MESDEGEKEDVDGCKSNDNDEDEAIGDLDGFKACVTSNIRTNGPTFVYHVSEAKH